jgi:hypothetical protein
MLGRIFGFKGEEVTGGCIEWRVEDLHDMYLQQQQHIYGFKGERIRMIDHVARMLEREGKNCLLSYYSQLQHKFLV